MLTHFEKIIDARDDDARVVALHKCIREVFAEDICGTKCSKKMKEGWFIDVTTPKHIITFHADYRWGCSLSIVSNPGYRIREIWYVEENEAVLFHKVYKDGRLQRVD